MTRDMVSDKGSFFLESMRQLNIKGHRFEFMGTGLKLPRTDMEKEIALVLYVFVPYGFFC